MAKNKLPKWAIRQAGGINKKAWRLYRGKKTTRRAKTYKKPRRTPRRVSGASHGSTHSSKPGWGTAFKTGRTVDVFSGPAQGSLQQKGLTKEAGEDALYRYSAGLSKGKFDSDAAKGTYGGIGTGLVRNWVRSKMGIYRGIGRKKYLSIVMGANPELLAYTEADPFTDVALWNEVRGQYDRAYGAAGNVWNSSPSSPWGARFWQSIGLDVFLKFFQKAAEIWINPMLPKGHNL